MIVSFQAEKFCALESFRRIYRRRAGENEQVKGSQVDDIDSNELVVGPPTKGAPLPFSDD